MDDFYVPREEALPKEAPLLSVRRSSGMLSPSEASSYMLTPVNKFGLVTEAWIENKISPTVKLQAGPLHPSMQYDDNLSEPDINERELTPSHQWRSSTPGVLGGLPACLDSSLGPATQTTNANLYLGRNRVPELFAALLAALMIDCPEDPLQYLDEKLDQIQRQTAAHRAEGARPPPLKLDSLIAPQHPSARPVHRALVHPPTIHDLHWQTAGSGAPAFRTTWHFSPDWSEDPAERAAYTADRERQILMFTALNSGLVGMRSTDSSVANIHAADHLDIPLPKEPYVPQLADLYSVTTASHQDLELLSTVSLWDGEGEREHMG